MTDTCSHFSQNAWKKDLCSNCFKSKDEHNISCNSMGGESKSHYVSTVYPSRGFSWRQNGTIEVQSILKGLKGEPKRKGSVVHFPTEESEVIGYGGDEYFFSDEEEVQEPTDDDSVSAEEDTGISEKDLEVQRITKNNTDYNMLITNLSDKYVGPLKLGNTLHDTDGKRKTLLVSVTPFGEKMNGDSSPMCNTKTNGFNKTFLETAKISFTKATPDKNPSNPAIENCNNTDNKSSLCDDNNINKNNSINCKDNNANDLPIIPTAVVITELANSDNIKIQSTEIITKLTDAAPDGEHSSESSSDSDPSSASEGDNEVNTTNDAKVSDEGKVSPVGSESDSKVSRIPVNKLRFPADKLKCIATLNSKFESNLPKPATRKTADTKLPSHFANLPQCIHQKNEETVLTDCDSKNVNSQVSDKLQPLNDAIDTKVKDCKTESSKIKVSKKNSDTSEDKFSLKREANELDICSRNSGSYSLVPTTTSAESCVLTKCIDISEFSNSSEKFVEKAAVLKEGKPEENVWCHPIKAMREEMFPVEESRELAGEPDGRADPPPALDPLPSFLHGSLSACKQSKIDKPQIPIKPDKVLKAASKRPPALSFQTTVCQEQSQSDADGRTPQKRPAPKPPTTPSEESLPQISKLSPTAVTNAPQYPSRRSSASVENLSTNGHHSSGEHEKKKSAGRRFCFRKLLRFGVHKDGRSASSGDINGLDSANCLPVVPRPKLEIIHPLDLNGSGVQVVTGDGKHISRNSEPGSPTGEPVDSCVLASVGSPGACTSGRPNKPPPPPRNQSLGLESMNKPSRPPPPKSLEILHKQKSPPTSRVPIPSSPTNNVYANLDVLSNGSTVSSSPGEIRSGLTPHKPQRTASMRDNNVKKIVPVAQIDDGSGYEAVELGNNKMAENENVYECVTSPGQSSSPESDKLLLRYGNSWNLDNTSEGLKSLPYCGSETESDIYSPYSFYSSEDCLPNNGDEDYDWASSVSQLRRSSKLHLRKGRSVVHKSLEDNYGAVITANHEALANVLEQVNQGPVTPPVLRALKTSSNLCWNDFTISDEKRVVVSGKRVFHLAHWGTYPVTLCVALDQGLPSRGCFSLSPIVEFTDLISSQYLPVDLKSKTQLVQVFVAVLPKLQVDTIHSYSCALKDKFHSSIEEHIKSGSFILLQLVNALKHLQAQGVEEVPLSLSSFILCSDEQEQVPRIYVLQGVPHRDDEGPLGSLCCCALTALNELVPKSPITNLISGLLEQERAISLSRVKSVLEFSLWGPTDIVLESSVTSRELALRRWLDLERATMLQGLVRTRVGLNAFEECHLLYLVHTSAKNTCEASVMLDTCSKSEA